MQGVSRQVHSLQSSLRVAKLRYQGELANYLDVLIAQRNLFEAELALTGTHRLHLVPIVQHSCKEGVEVASSDRRRIEGKEKACDASQRPLRTASISS